MTCKCGEPALYTCSWKLRKPFMIWAKDLKEGDQMQIPKKIGYSGVNQIEDGITIGFLHVWLEFDPHAKPYILNRSEPVMVRRNGACEAPCCVNCAREVAENRHYCRAHWDAWERRDAIDQREEVTA